MTTSVADVLPAIPASIEGSDSSAPVESFADRQLRIARETRRQIFVDHWERSCPLALRECDSAHPDLVRVRPLIERILVWEPGPVGLIASGPTGCGKSRAMFALCKRLVHEGHEVRIWSAHDWFGKLQEHVTFGRDDAADWVHAMAAVPILFIDDLGQEAVLKGREDWARSWWFQFLDLRYGARRPLLLTTNQSSVDMANGDPLVKSHPLVRRLCAIAEPLNFWPPKPKKGGVQR